MSCNPISKTIIKKLCREILKDGDLEVLSVKMVRQQVRDILLKDGTYTEADFTSSDFKSDIKEITMKLMEDGVDEEESENDFEEGTAEGTSEKSESDSESEMDDDLSNDEDDDDSETENRIPQNKKNKGKAKTTEIKKRRAVHKNSKKKRNTSIKKQKTVVDDVPKSKGQLERSQLMSMHKAMSFSPRIFFGLKEVSIEEGNEILKSRLREAGAKFNNIPTDREISAAKKVTEMKRELEGIDTDCILTSSRNRPSRTSISSLSAVSTSSTSETKSRLKEKKVINDGESSSEDEF